MKNNVMTIAGSYDFTTMEDLFSYIIDSEINGQPQQVKSIYMELNQDAKRNFIQWLDHYIKNGECTPFAESCVKVKTLCLESLVEINPGKAISDKDNYDYLRGFTDGYGGENPHEWFPSGFKDINQVYDRVGELEEKRITNT